MGKWVKIVGVIGVVLVAALVATIVLISQYDYNQLKPAIAQTVKNATGRDLVINGDLDLAVSLTPTLVVSDIAFANAAWGEKGNMVRLEKLAAKVSLLALLQGRVDIDYLALDGLTVVLQTDGKGLANWEFEAQGAVEPSAVAAGDGELKLIPGARDIRLSDVDVTYIDGTTGKRLHLLLEHANFTAAGFNAPMYATAVAAYQGVELDATLEMGSLRQLVGSSGDAFPVALELTAPGLLLTVKGSVDQPQAGMKVNATADLRVSDTATAARLAGASLPDLDGLKMGLQISGGGNAYTFSAIDARVGASDVGGDITMQLAGPRPVFSGKLTSKVMDLDQIFGIEAPKAASAVGLRSSGPEVATVTSEDEAVALFSAEPLALDGLMAADLNVTVLAGRAKLSNMNIDAVKAGVKLTNGKLQVQPLSLNLEGGEVEGQVQFDGAAQPATLQIATTIQGLDIGPVLQALGKGDLVTLVLSGSVDATSHGNSVQQLMGNMNGTARFAGQDGKINDDAITSLISGLDNELPWIKSEDSGSITCLVADWPIESGIATAKTVLADTPSFAVAVTGNVDLGGERFHLTVVPKAKKTSLASFAVPMRIKGALSAPYLDVSPAEAVVGTVTNIFKAPASLVNTIVGAGGGSKANNPCFKALSEGKTSATDTAAPDTPPAKEESPKPSAPSAVEKLDKALQGLFGK